MERDIRSQVTLSLDSKEAWRVHTQEDGRMETMGEEEKTLQAEGMVWTGFGGRHGVHWRREWQTTSVFLPWEPHEQYEKAKW